MKLGPYLYALLVLLEGAVVNAVSPPAAILHCVNEVAHGCSGFHSNYACICGNRDRVLYCLATVSPYGNYLEARDHFLGTCIDRVPALIDDPDYNLNLPRRPLKTTVPDNTMISSDLEILSSTLGSEIVESPIPTAEPSTPEKILTSSTESDGNEIPLTTTASDIPANSTPDWTMTVTSAFTLPGTVTSVFGTTAPEPSASNTESPIITVPLLPTEPLLVPVPDPTANIPVHIPSDECDDEFEDDPEEGYDDSCECQCQCDCGEEEEEEEEGEFEASLGSLTCFTTSLESEGWRVLSLKLATSNFKRDGLVTLF